jgi:putative transposase
MLRGNGGQAIFSDDADRKRFCELAAEGVERFGHHVHAYCLMGNHVHLAVRVAEVPLSRIIQNLSFRYTRWFNRRARRVGHLFQGRYRALLVEANSYLLELVRYIHVNPVRSGFVRDAGEWVWSGHRAYLGKVREAWLDSSFVLRMLAERDVRLARRRYAGFVREGLGEVYREELHRGDADPRVRGGAEFVEELLSHTKQARVSTPTLNDIVACVCDVWRLDESVLRLPGRRHDAGLARAVVGWLATETHAALLGEVAERFGRDIATLSHLVARLRVNANEDATLRRRLEQIRRQVGLKYATMQA